MSERDAEFVEFVQMRGPALRRTAFLMCGDWHRAEDVLQTALIKLYRSWSRIRDTTAEAYARQVVVRTLIDESRRFRWRRERTTDTVPETVAPAVEVEDGLDVRRALEQLPPRQRAVVVLRYWDDLSIEETARVLGCAPGTVKSQAAKGLAALRRLLAERQDEYVLEGQR
ncbi:MAG TPA: SigE family RNA polymerase sigma factor [Pseudonocardiaceae bacterium]